MMKGYACMWIISLSYSTGLGSTVLYCLQDLKYAPWWHGGPDDVRKIPREWTIRCSTMVALEFLPNLASGSYHSSRPLQQPVGHVNQYNFQTIKLVARIFSTSAVGMHTMARDQRSFTFPNEAARLEYLFFLHGSMFATCSFSRKDDCGSIRIRSGGSSERIGRPLHHRWLMLFWMLNLLWLRWWWGNPQSFHWIWTRAGTQNLYRDYTFIRTKNRVSHLIFIMMSLEKNASSRFHGTVNTLWDPGCTRTQGHSWWSPSAMPRPEVR